MGSSACRMLSVSMGLLLRVSRIVYSCVQDEKLPAIQTLIEDFGISSSDYGGDKISWRRFQLSPLTYTVDKLL